MSTSTDDRGWLAAQVEQTRRSLESRPEWMRRLSYWEGEQRHLFPPVSDRPLEQEKKMTKKQNTRLIVEPGPRGCFEIRCLFTKKLLGVFLRPGSHDELDAQLGGGYVWRADEGGGFLSPSVLRLIADLLEQTNNLLTRSHKV